MTIAEIILLIGINLFCSVISLCFLSELTWPSKWDDWFICIGGSVACFLIGNGLFFVNFPVWEFGELI